MMKSSQPRGEKNNTSGLEKPEGKEMTVTRNQISGAENKQIYGSGCRGVDKCYKQGQWNEEGESGSSWWGGTQGER